MPVSKQKFSAGDHNMSEHHLKQFGFKILFVLTAVVLLYLALFLGASMQKTLKEISFVGRSTSIQKTISVSADATVTARPDIGSTTMGVFSEGDTVAAAQEQNSQKMNQLILRLGQIGIAQEDIQTINYNVYPQYDYLPDKGQVLRGYQVDQSVKIKIRDVNNASSVLALAGEVGANNVGGLTFTIDDNDVYVAQARKEALEKVHEKARDLTQMLGVRIVGVVSYSESGNNFQPYQPLTARSEAFGLGGGAPDIEPGSSDVMLSVNVVFEIE